MKQPKPKPAFKAAPFTVTHIKGKKHFTVQVTNSTLTDWIDKQDVQNALHISDRTLRTLRKTRRIPFSPLGGKIYYYLPGILALLEDNLIR
jgi:hypothetical protein